MKAKKKFTNLLFKTSLVFLGWLIVALFISTMTFLNQIQGDYWLTLGVIDVILFEVICISPWIISTPVIICTARTFRFEKEVIFKSLSAHLLVIVLVFGFHSFVQSNAAFIFYDFAFSWSYIQRDFIRFLDMRLLLYFGVVLGVYAMDFQRKNRESKLREPRLKAQLNDAKFHALLNQIQPTFLLNCINDIREKIRNQPDKSEQTLTKFSDLLRVMLQNADKEEVTIQKDLESYHLYLELLEIRFGIRIEKRTDIKEECYKAMIPAYLVYLMLILLIEDVITAETQSLGSIQGVCYSARRVDTIIHLDIKINGLRLTSANLWSYLNRTHFKNTRQRLKRKYDENIVLEIQQAGQAIQTTLRIPYKEQEANKDSFEIPAATTNSEDKLPIK